MSGYEEYGLRSCLAGKYRIGLNIVHTGKIGIKGLFLEYGEYSAEYFPHSRNKPFTPILPVRTIFSPILYLPARPDLSPYIPHSHSSVFIARGIITGGGQPYSTGQPRILL